MMDAARVSPRAVPGVFELSPSRPAEPRQRRSRWRGRADALTAGAVLLVVGLLHAGTDVFGSLERRFYDQASTASERQPSDRIAVIAIDDASIASIGRWPWPREVHADLIDRLSAAGAKTIAHTAFFFEPQTDRGLAYIRQLAEQSWVAWIVPHQHMLTRLIQPVQGGSRSLADFRTAARLGAGSRQPQCTPGTGRRTECSRGAIESAQKFAKASRPHLWQQMQTQAGFEFGRRNGGGKRGGCRHGDSSLNSCTAILAAFPAITLIALRGSRRSRMSLVFAAFIGVIVVLFNWAAIKDYLSLILDIDSPTRGVDSGATGRTEIWRMGIELVFSDAALLFTGRGIRSALPDLIGFPVESSYINLALEHGLFFGSLITLAFVVTACRALHQGLQPGQPRYQLFMVGLMLVFMLAQSFFNRYLIGVGNPYSLWVLVLILQVNLRPMSAFTHRSRTVSRSAYPSHRLDRSPT